MARRYEYCVQHEKLIFISSSYRVMFFLLYGQKSKQANREHRNPAGKHTPFSRVTYFFISSLVKIFFRFFTSENMENTSALVYDKTPITI